MTTERRKRRHAAAGARIFVAGLSASGAIGLMVAMASADLVPSASTSTAGSMPVPTPAPAPVVVVVRRPGDTATVTPVAPPPVAPTAAAPIAASHAS